VDETYIKLFRGIEKWEWYTDANTFRLFMHLLIRANYKASSFRGHDIPAGSIITGYPALAKQLNLTVRNVRTAISHLKTTGEVTVKVTSKFSIVTIVNWGEYQSGDRLADRQVTGKRQASDRQVTPSKEGKKERKKEYNQISATALDYSGWPSMPSDQTLKDWLAMRKRLKANVTQTVINRLATKLRDAVSEGFTVDDCLAECVQRNWKGFDVEWMRGTSQTSGSVNYLKDILNA